MEPTPPGPETLAVNPFYDPRHDNAGHNRDQEVQQVLHRRHLLVLKLGGCPTDSLRHKRRKLNLSFQTLFDCQRTQNNDKHWIPTCAGMTEMLSAFESVAPLPAAACPQIFRMRQGKLPFRRLLKNSSRLRSAKIKKGLAGYCCKTLIFSGGAEGIHSITYYLDLYRQ